MSITRDNQRWETGIVSSGSIFENKMAIDNKMAILGSFILAKYPASTRLWTADPWFTRPVL